MDVRLDSIEPRALLDELGIMVRRSRPAAVRFDLSGLTDIDAAGVATLRVATRRLESANIAVELHGASTKVAQIIQDTPVVVTASARAAKSGVVERLGEMSQSAWRALVALADMTFELIRGLLESTLGRGSSSFRDTLDQIERIGADSVIITTLLSFLLGLVLAFQTWVQLHTFGADQFVLEFVGIGMSRGFAPFIVAVLIAGRTGSAIGAEIAAMEMRQENDALRVMGISPIRHLVVPRMIALTLVVPAVNIIATAAGIAGGFVVMVALSPNWVAALDRMLVHLELSDLWLGTVKAVLFGWVVGLASAFTGFHSGFGALSIGFAATRAVVSSIFFIMVVDAIVTTIWTMAQ
ncbi:MAG: ABC transporter permease [Enhygromyxa sp.]